MTGPGPDTLIQIAADRRNLPALFAALPLLKEISSGSIELLAQEIEWFSMQGGTTLYSTGQVSDGLYVVINGALGVFTGHAGGGSRYVGQLSAGHTAGENEAISGGARTTTVIALRDSEVARLSPATFERLTREHPQVLRYIVQELADRVDTLQRPGARPLSVPKTFALVPADAAVDATRVGGDLVTCLRRFGRAELVTSSQATDRTTHWFHRLERANDFVIYVADLQPTSWTRLCMRQADMLLLAADGDAEPRPWPALGGSTDGAIDVRPAELLLLHRSRPTAGIAGRWLKAQRCRRLHHVHAMKDVARVARLLTGRGLGLVLSGGGARGFAHIGVMRALHEARIDVDSIGTASIGAVIGAGWAAGWDYKEMLERIRRGFVATNPLSDYTLPLLSLVGGRKVCRLMRHEFGDTDIEDLQLPYFCVSASLTSGQLAVHRSGRLWSWLRASISIPGILPPVFTGGQAYVDGATLNNLPVDVMRDDHHGRIVAVDAGGQRGFVTDLEMTETPPLWRLPGLFGKRRGNINIMQVLLRAGMLNSAALSIQHRELADVLLSPPLEGVDLLDWSAFERVIDIGYRHARQVLDSRKGLLSG
ncbi:MAG: patatin-like phospholipase family protein [Proteobacteria bacterium]|nr:patatin-like phospholipase family protein [Pseudomonadota bacterium]